MRKNEAPRLLCSGYYSCHSLEGLKAEHRREISYLVNTENLKFVFSTNPCYGGSFKPLKAPSDILLFTIYAQITLKSLFSKKAIKK